MYLFIRHWLAFSLALGALVSLGTASADQSGQFETQHEAAEWILNKMNPMSVRKNVETGGYIYRTADGRFSVTEPFFGNHGNIYFPPPETTVPAGTEVTASWHTHGATMPNIVSETFSPQDIKLNQKFSIDGYLGTPEGKFKYYELNNPNIFTLGKIEN